MALKIWRRMPWTSEATAITVVTPMTTPRIVRVERSLLALIASSAMAIPSPRFWAITRSLHPERGDGIEPGGPGRGIDPEDEAGAGAQRERDTHRPRRDPGRERGEARHPPRESPPAHDPQEPAQGGEDQRFHQELPADVAPGRAQRLAQADLAGALGHRHQHDVHDDDAADHDADRHDG